MSDKRKPDHPPPWRWDYKPSARVPWALVDADNMSMGVVAVMPDADAIPPDVRELIRLAPTMEALLRKCEWDTGGECPACGDAGRVHGSDCELASVLAALDAARKEST